jgi:hypothetical protein|tara:strand:+ start:286 stop:390 length:105 start_codon:yes stop_codon:yes gene_type:complete
MRVRVRVRVRVRRTIARREEAGGQSAPEADHDVP